MSPLAEVGHVYEVLREHYAMSVIAGELFTLEVGELLLLVTANVFEAQALRLESGQIVHITLLEFGDFMDRTYGRVWPE